MVTNQELDLRCFVFITNLKADDNSLIKFADNCTFGVAAVSDLSTESEVISISEWRVAVICKFVYDTLNY